MKQSIGAVATPAPIWPIPVLACRMPVLTFGVIPSSATYRTSTPTGVPLKSIVASLNRVLRAWQMRIIDEVCEERGGIVVEGRDIGTVVAPDGVAVEVPLRGREVQ